MSFLNDYSVRVIHVEAPDRFRIKVLKSQPQELIFHLANVAPCKWQSEVNSRTGLVESLLVPSKEWSEPAKYHVQDLFEMKDLEKCRAEVLHVNNDGTWSGDLHYEKDGCFKSLKNDLVKSEFAKHTQTTNTSITSRNNIPRKISPMKKGANLSVRQKEHEDAQKHSSLLGQYIFFGTKPHPGILDRPTSNQYSEAVNLLHNFSKAEYNDYCWAAVNMARNIFVTMPAELQQFDNNGISVVLPDLNDTLDTCNQSGTAERQSQLNAIFVVPSGAVGSQLFKNLDKRSLDFKGVKFLPGSSQDSDVSRCQILIVTPAKLRHFMNSSLTLKLDSLCYLAFIQVDDLADSEEDLNILAAFKNEFRRFRNVSKNARLFGLTKSWSPKVDKFFREWFLPVNPLNYFLDLVEASVYMKTSFSFIHTTLDSLRQSLLGKLKKLREARHSIAICCADDDYLSISEFLASKSIIAVKLELQLGARQITSELDRWALEPVKSVLLVPDSVLKPANGLIKPDQRIGATAIIHAGTVKDKTALRSRFQLMKSTWINSPAQKCESIFMFHSLPEALCNPLNSLLERTGFGRSTVVADWGSGPTKSQATVKSTTADGPVIKQRSQELCRNVLYRAVSCPNESRCRYRHLMKHELDDCTSQQSLYTPVQHLIKGGLAVFQILRVVEGNHFIGIMKAPSSCLETMIRIDRGLRVCFKNRSNQDETTSATYKPGVLCGAAFHGKSVLRRVVVVQNLGVQDSSFYPRSATLQTKRAHVSYRVRLIDSGRNEMDITDDKLFALSADVAKEPWQSIDIILVNIRPVDRSWPAQVKEMLQKRIVGKDFEATVSLVLRHHVFVMNLVNREICSTIGNRATVVDVRDLLTNGQSAVADSSQLPRLVAMCKKAGISIPSHSDSVNNASVGPGSPEVAQPAKKQPPEPQSYTLPYDKSPSLELIGSVNIRISAVRNPGTFFVQRIDSLENFDRLQRGIADWVDKEGEVLPLLGTVLEPNMLCLARLPIDEGRCWSRVVIQEIDLPEDNVHVFAVDHGEFETIPLSDVWTIKQHLSKYPSFAIECQLAHVKPRNDFNEDAFSEDAADMLWNIGQIKESFSRTFRLRVINKAKRGYHCKSGCYLVEMTPAFKLEKEVPPREPHTELSAAGQLVRLGVVSADWDVIINGLKSLEFSSSTPHNVVKFFSQKVPDFLNQPSDVLFNTLLECMDTEEAVDCLPKLWEDSTDAWIRCVDYFTIMAELGQYNVTYAALETLLRIVPDNMQPAKLNVDECDKIYATVCGAVHRLLPLATYLVSLSLEDLEGFENDDYLASSVCLLMEAILTIARQASGNSEEVIQLCVRCGLIPVLMRQTIVKTEIDKIQPCFHLLTTLISSPVFRPWLRKMNTMKYLTGAGSNRMLVTHPWEMLTEIVSHLWEARQPNSLDGLLKSLANLMQSDIEYVSTINDSDLGERIKQLPDQIAQAKMESSDHWHAVDNICRFIRLLFDANMMSEFDPETDSDRYGEQRLRPQYHLPKQDSSGPPQALNEAQSKLEDDSFGTMLWSQDSRHVYLQFDNASVTRQTLRARVSSDPSNRPVLKLTLNSGRCLDVYLFGEVNPDSLKIRDRFEGALLKLDKSQIHADWIRFEALDKRLANLKPSFDRIEELMSDDDEDEEEEEFRNECIKVKRAELEQGEDQENETAVATELSMEGLDEAEKALLQQVSAKLPQDFNGDDDVEDFD